MQNQKTSDLLHSNWNRHIFYILISITITFLLYLFIGETMPSYLIYIASCAVFLISIICLFLGFLTIYWLRASRQTITWARCKEPFLTAFWSFLATIILFLNGNIFYQSWYILRNLNDDTESSPLFYLLVLSFALYVILWAIARHLIQFYHGTFTTSGKEREDRKRQKDNSEHPQEL